MSQANTLLDQRLQEIAAKNWPQFVALIGDDAILSAKICLLRQERNSYGQIAVKLNLTKKVARYRCNDCGGNPPE